jgi:Ca2+-binding RTX toxin-like protein
VSGRGTGASVRKRLLSRLVVLVFSLLVLAVPALGGAVPPTQAESEANGDPGSADPLPGAGCFVIGSGAISPEGDQDYWSFSGTQGATVWAYIDTGGSQNPGADSRHAGMRLLDPSGVGTIERDDTDATGNGGDSSIETGASPAIGGATLLANGTHYLRPVESGNNEVIDPYRLFLAVATRTTATLEPNDTTAQATPITECPDVRSGLISPGTDVDLYAVNVAAGEVLFIELDGDPDRDGDGANFVVDLLNSNGSDILLTADSSQETVPGTVETGNPAAEAFSFNIATAGTYFVRVRGWDPGHTGAYRLMIAGGVVTGGGGGGGGGKTSCAGTEANQVGTSGNDVLAGTKADETFVSLGGNDKIMGGGGKDTICAGPGKDTAKGGGGKDTLRGGSGKDRLAGQGAGDALRGQGGSDRLNGGPGRDRCAQGGGTGSEASCER